MAKVIRVKHSKCVEDRKVEAARVRPCVNGAGKKRAAKFQVAKAWKNVY